MSEQKETSLNDAIIKIKVALQGIKLKQSGKNTFAGFTYYELSDFLPSLNKLMLENGVNDQIIIGKEYAELTLHKGSEKQTYTIPFIMFETPKNKNGTDSMQHIQYLGALNTYYKRYLYLNAFGITDGEVIDAMNINDLELSKKVQSKQEEQKPQPKPIVRINQEQIKELESLLTSDEHKADFLAKCKIAKLEDMPLSWFDKALASLK